MDYAYITYIIGILALGSATINFTRKVQIPTTLVLLILGIAVKLSLGSEVSAFPQLFILGAAGVLLAVAVFESGSHISVRHMDSDHESSVKLFFLNFFMTAAVVMAISFFLFDLGIIQLALFAVILSGASYIHFKQAKTRLSEMLEYETWISTFVMLLIAYMIYDYLRLKEGAINIFGPNLSPFILQSLIAAGVGILVSIIFFSTRRRFHENQASRTIVILAALSSYLLSEALGGNGVIGIGVFALFFGSLHIEKKEHVKELARKIRMPLKIVVVILLGMFIDLSLDMRTLAYALIVFIAIISIRYFSVSAVFGERLKLKEKLFLTLNDQKTMPAAAITLMIVATGILSIQLTTIITLVMLFSLTMSFAATKVMTKT